MDKACVCGTQNGCSIQPMQKPKQSLVSKALQPARTRLFNTELKAAVAQTVLSSKPTLDLKISF